MEATEALTVFLGAYHPKNRSVQHQQGYALDVRRLLDNVVSTATLLKLACGTEAGAACHRSPANKRSVRTNGHSRRLRC